MGTNKEVAPKGGWAKFMHWYESYQGKKIVGCVYSLGASIVIVGALFKIMHFPGAGPMLIVGMGVEAILFAIGCLDKPHAEFHWENVFPQLVGFGADPILVEEMKSRPCPTLLGAGEGAGNADVPALSEKDLDSLKAGITNLAKTANQLNELGTVATATNNLTSKLEAAGAAAEQFAEAGKAINEQSAVLGGKYAQVAEDMQKVVTGTKAYEAQVGTISTQLTALNAVYEMQIKALQAQVEAYKAQSSQVADATAQVEKLSADVKLMTQQASEAMKNQEAYVAGAKQLANQVADLNKVYGNMLNALS